MSVSKYYVTVAYNNMDVFEDYIALHAISYSNCVTRWAKLELISIYFIIMDRQEAVVLKLAFPILGIVDFDKPIDAQHT